MNPTSELRKRYLFAFWLYWRLEQPEINPFFNFTYAVVTQSRIIQINGKVKPEPSDG
ncbi:MAG: hypothetical protein R3C56_25085 [Pirellulaceae bacterium]